MVSPLSSPSATTTAFLQHVDALDGNIMQLDMFQLQDKKPSKQSMGWST
jgi:hypothetical protein